MLAVVALAPHAPAAKDPDAQRLATIEKKAELAIKRIVKSAAKRIRASAKATSKELRALEKGVRRGEFTAAKRAGHSAKETGEVEEPLRVALVSCTELLADHVATCTLVLREVHDECAGDPDVLAAGEERLLACQVGMRGFGDLFVSTLDTTLTECDRIVEAAGLRVCSAVSDQGLGCTLLVEGLPPLNGPTCASVASRPYLTTGTYATLCDAGGGVNAITTRGDDATTGSSSSGISVRDPVSFEQVFPMNRASSSSALSVMWTQVANSFSGGGDLLVTTTGNQGGASSVVCAVIPSIRVAPEERDLRNTVTAIRGSPRGSLLVRLLDSGNEVFNSNLNLVRKTTQGAVDAVRQAAERVYRNGDLPSKVAPLDDAAFPCGPGPNGFTVCAEVPSADPGGDLLVVGAAYADDVQLADPQYRYQYGFVFDQDGFAGNDYVASPQFAGDYYQGTDKWYSLEYTPGVGWKLKVTDARNGGFVAVASAARAIIQGNSIVLAVPAAEFSVAAPAFRTTSFRHTGDYGQNPPHDWLADYFPVPGDPLGAFPEP